MQDAASLLMQVGLVFFAERDGEGAEGALRLRLWPEDSVGGEPNLPRIAIPFTSIPYSRWWAAAGLPDPLPAFAARVSARADGPRLLVREGAVAELFAAEVVGAVAALLAERAGFDEPRQLVERVYWQNRALASLLTDRAWEQAPELSDLLLARGRLVRLAEVLLTEWWPVAGGGDERLRVRLAEVVAPQPIDDLSVWMVSVPEVAPPSVEGVQTAVTLFRARYLQWMAEVAATGDGLASAAGEELAGVASGLEELRGSLDGLTPESRQGVWDRFVQLVRTYNDLRSRLAEDGNPGPVPPAVSEMSASSQGAGSGRDTPMDLSASPGPMLASALLAASVPTVLESAETGVGRLVSAVNRLSPWDPARPAQALVDPSPWPGKPGLASEELQSLVSVGPGFTELGPIRQAKTIAKVPSLGITLEVVPQLMVQGRSFRWHLSDYDASHSNDYPIRGRRYWNVIRVASSGTGHEEGGRGGRYTAEQQHELNKAMIRWLMWTGRDHMTLHAATNPRTIADRINDWAEMSQGEGRVAAYAVRDALLVSAEVWLDPELSRLKMGFSDARYQGVANYRSTVDVELAGIVHLLRMSQGKTQGSGAVELAALATVQDRIIHFSGDVADLFARSMTAWPLTEGNIQALLKSEELLALQGALTAVLTHVLARVVALFEQPEDALFALARQDLAMLVAKIPDETRVLLQQSADFLVNLISDFDFFVGLERRPGPGWIDSPSTLNGDLTVREVLMAVFTGSREVRQDALFESATTLPPQFPAEGTGWRWAFTLQHHLSDTGSLPSMGQMMTLVDTDAHLASTVRIARVAHDVARGAKEWTQRWGGVRTAARIFSATRGMPVPLGDGLFQAYGRMWKWKELNGVLSGWYPLEDAPDPIPGAVSRSVGDLMRAAVSMLERVVSVRVSPVSGSHGVAHDPEAFEGSLRLEMASDGSASPVEMEFPIISIQPDSWWEISDSDPLPALAARVSVHPDGPRLEVRRDAVPGVFEAEVPGAFAGYVAEWAGVDEPLRLVERVYWQNKALVSLLSDAEPHNRPLLEGMRGRLLRLAEVLLTQWWPVAGDGDEQTRELLEEVRLPAVATVERGRPEAGASPLVEPDAMDLDADGRLPQVDVVSGEVVSSPPNSGQPTSESEPGLVAEEL
ncbi:hypothetical protein AB0J84_31220 [Micromonospora arborensis]|uniref:hypothetical protein n=1 Tax=Micromonospora arborensis TaxID=2116518 RepID=UPI00342616CF